MEKTKRCQCRNITNGKICLHKSKKIFIINNKYYCKLHMNYYNHKFATLIQSFYRGYKKRQYLNNIYIKLPNDIQNHILYFVKKDFYIKRFNKKLDNLIENKIYNYNIEFNNKFNADSNIPFTMLNYLSTNQKYIIHIYKLFVKYKSILKNIEIINTILINNLHSIKKIINEYEYMIFNAYSQHIYTLTHVLYYNIDKIINPNTTLSSMS